MQFIDLKAQYTRLKPDIDGAIQKVLDHGQYIMGPEVKEFEDKLSKYIGVKHCIGISSGTDALVTILMTLGIGPGDLVIVPDFTFIATAEAVTLTGADLSLCMAKVTISIIM
jgi:UDP-2-acetamido-2-deoxy-ribo-hexuluronate aminotransferase